MASDSFRPASWDGKREGGYDVASLPQLVKEVTHRVTFLTS